MSGSKQLCASCFLAFAACEPELSRYEEVQRIWDGECVDQCHEPGGDIEDEDPPAGPIRLHRGGDAYDAIVGVPSEQLDSMNLIEPGDPDQSYVWHKLNDTHEDVGGLGDFMPKIDEVGVDPTLSDSQLDIIRAWIEDGAPH